MTRRLILVLLLVAAPAWAQDEDLAPDGTNASDSNTTCNATLHNATGEAGDDPDAPGNDWCAADGNNVSWAARLTFPPPASALDDTADAQAIELYVRAFDEGQTGEPTIRVDIYDGVACADLHETGASTVLTDAGFPAKVTDNWTAAGLSSRFDVCVDIVCTKAGGGPGARNSCDIDAIEWDVTWGAAGADELMIVG